MKIIKVKGEFSAVSPPLACESSGGTFHAASAAWIAAQDPDQKAASIGWTRERADGSTNITRKVYVELWWKPAGPNDPGYQIWRFNDPGDGKKEYRMELDQGTGEWKFYFSGSQLTLTNPTYPQAAKDYWKDGYCTQGKWCGETHDLGSRMPGTATNHFAFETCKIMQVGDWIWHDGAFTVFNPQPSANYDVQKISDTKVEIWDKR